VHKRPVLRLQEPLFDLVIEQRQQRLEVAPRVEHTDRFGVDAQLRPGQDLEQFLQRAHAAGQGHETVGQVGHQRLAVVHAADHVQFGQACVGEFLGLQRRRDDADYLAAGRQSRVGDDAHQADVAAAVDNSEPAADGGDGKFAGRGGVLGPAADVRAAEDAESPHIDAQAGPP